MIENLYKFFLKLFFLTCISLILILSINYQIQQTKHFYEIISGYVVSILVFLGGVISIQWSFKKSIKVFMSVVLGGIIVRFLVIAIIIYLILKYTTLHIIYFIITFVFFYLVFQFFEFQFINKKIKKANR